METLTEILGLSVHDMGNDMEKTIEQHRAEFEEWAKWRGYHRDELARCRIGIVSPRYFNINTENAFEAWLAARGIKE